MTAQVRERGTTPLNKRFKRDSQRVAFLLCVGFCDYGVMRKVSSSVGCPLSGRYVTGKFSGMKILSDRLMMSPISADDWTLFYELHTDPAVISLCFDQPSVLEIESKFQSRLEHWTPDSEHWLCLLISELKTGHKVGITGFCLRNGVAEVGFMLLPSFYGNGYGTESLQALIDYSAKHFGLEGFMAVVTEGNVGSEKVLAKSGFTLHRIVPDAYEIGGQRYADHVYIMGRIVT